MSTRFKIVAALVLLFAAAAARANTLGAFGGAWSIELVRGPQHARLIFEFDARRGLAHRTSEREIDPAALGLSEALPAADERSVRFTFAREADSFSDALAAEGDVHLSIDRLFWLRARGIHAACLRRFKAHGFSLDVILLAAPYVAA